MLDRILAARCQKKRLVLNLRHMNKLHVVRKQKLKYEDMSIAMMLFRPGEYMFTFDLKSGYHHVEVVQAHHKYMYLGFDGPYDVGSSSFKIYM